MANTVPGRLAAAFPAVVLGSCLVFALWFYKFRFPDADAWTLFTEAPAALTAMVATPSGVLGLWWWLRRKKSRPGGPVLEVFGSVLRSTPALSVAMAGLLGADGYWVYRLSTTRVVSVAVSPKREWRLYVDCADMVDPRSSCGAGKPVGDQLSLRIAQGGSSVVVEHLSTRRAFVVRESGTLSVAPPLPAFDRDRKQLLVFEFPSAVANARFAYIARNIAQAVTQLALGDDTIEVIEAKVPFEAEVADAWREQGLDPLLSIWGDYDDSEVRASLGTSDTVLEVPLRVGEAADSLESLPVGLGIVSPTFLAPGKEAGQVRLTLGPSYSAHSLTTSYPADVARSVALLVAMKQLAAGRPAKGAHWLDGAAREEQESGGGLPVRPGDALLTKAVRMIVALHSTQCTAARDALVEAIDRLPRVEPGGADVVLSASLHSELPRLLIAGFQGVNSCLTPQLLARQREVTEKLEAEGRRLKARGDAVALARTDLLPWLDELMRPIWGPRWREVLAFCYRNYHLLLRTTWGAMDDAAHARLDEELGDRMRELLDELLALLSEFDTSCGDELSLTGFPPRTRVVLPRLEVAAMRRAVLGCEDCRLPPWMLDFYRRVFDRLDCE